MKAFQQILAAATATGARGHPWCLATLVHREGSSYRLPGARLLVHPDGGTLGVLSGGCLEEEIGKRGREVMDNNEPQLLFFDTRKLFGCDGRLSVYLENIPAAGEAGNFLTEIAARISRRSLCRVSVPYADRRPSTVLPDKALVVEREGTFVQTLSLPPRLLVFGNGPEIGPLKAFGRGLGWEIIQHHHPDGLPLDFTADSATAAVVMTHQFGRDLAALDRLLPLGLPYLGLLGPKRRHAELLRRFTEFRELQPEWLETLHAPAGLDIGSEAPEEIAFSIIGEAAAVLAHRRGGFLREAAGTIHRLEEARA